MSVKSVLTGFHHDSVRQCEESMLALLEPAKVLLDCGCADGTLTTAFADTAGVTTALGIEIMDLLAVDAEERGIRVLRADLNNPFALDDSCVDIVTANQVIEHLHNTDGFLSEIHRVLRPGGIFVLSTNNLAAWHNIAALLVGAQPFPADVRVTSVKVVYKPAHWAAAILVAIYAALSSSSSWVMGIGSARSRASTVM